MTRLGLALAVVLSVSLAVAGPVAAAKSPQSATVAINPTTCRLTSVATFVAGTVSAVSWQTQRDGAPVQAVAVTTFVRNPVQTSVLASAVLSHDAVQHTWTIIWTFDGTNGCPFAKVAVATRARCI